MLRWESRTTTRVLTSTEMILTSRNSSNLVPRVLSLLSQSSSFPGNEVVTEVAPSSTLPWRILRSHVKVSLAAYCQQKLFCAGHLFYYQDQNALSNAFLFKFFVLDLTSLTMEAIDSITNAITVYSCLTRYFSRGWGWRRGLGNFF